MEAFNWKLLIALLHLNGKGELRAAPPQLPYTKQPHNSSTTTP
jgi:hypothetical protein